MNIIHFETSVHLSLSELEYHNKRTQTEREAFYRGIILENATQAEIGFTRVGKVELEATDEGIDGGLLLYITGELQC